VQTASHQFDQFFGGKKVNEINVLGPEYAALRGIPDSACR